MYCILLIISSIVFSAVDDFNLKSEAKSKETMKENIVKIADPAVVGRRQLGFERFPAF